MNEEQRPLDARPDFDPADFGGDLGWLLFFPLFLAQSHYGWAYEFDRLDRDRHQFIDPRHRFKNL